LTCVSVIIDKTAQFVAKNGAAFEARIYENERNNPRFSFLQLNDPYRPYYDQKIEDYIKNQASSTMIQAEVSFASCVSN